MVSMSIITTTTILLVAIAIASSSITLTKYQPNWDSIDSRPLPAWYDEAKFGVFISWGLFSVPSFGSEWFWNYWRERKIPSYVQFMKKNYRPDFTYADFASQLTVEFYDPDYWADVIEAAGAKYVVFITKHHEGFTLWPSNVSYSWNSMDVGPKRDLVGEFAAAIAKKPDIKLGLYHSMFEWFNPLYLKDKANNFSTREFVTQKPLPELYELVNTYKPEIIWSDGAIGPWQYWKSPDFLAWLYNDSPVKDTVVTNDRWGDGIMCKHGGFYTCTDRYNPGHLVKHKWENAMTMERHSWGYRRDATLSSYLSIEVLLSELASTVSCGGNLLLNFGPTHDGRMIPIYEERLRQMGSWLKVNGEAIYASKPWIYQKDTVTKGVWYTSQNRSTGATDVYAIVLNWPPANLTLGVAIPSSSTVVTLLGYPKPIPYTPRGVKGIVLNIPVIPFNQMPCQWAWVFKMTNLKNK